MTRPLFVDVQNQSAAWDQTVNDNYRTLRESFPFPEYADLPTLTAARPPAQNEGCAAAISAPSWLPYWCDGTAWIVWPSQLVAHKTTHYAGGTDEVPHDNMQGTGANTHAQIDSHLADTANPHAVTAAQAGADPAGTAATAVSAHEALPDPHPGYQLETEKGVVNGYAALDAAGKVPLSQIPDLNGLTFVGPWDASTNTPALASGVGTENEFYVVSVAGPTSLDGISDWNPKDWAMFNGGVWRKIDNTDQVASVNGLSGVVVLSHTDVGAAAAVHGSNHSQGGSDPVNAEDLATAAANANDILYDDGAGGWTKDFVKLPEAFYTEQLTPAPTSGVAGGTFVTFHTINTPVLPAGDYLVMFGYEWSLNNTSTDIIVRVRVGGQDLINPGDTPGRSIHQQEVKDSAGTGTGGTDQVLPGMPGLKRVTLGAGAATVSLEFGKSAGTGTGQIVTVYSFKLFMFRVG